MTLGVRRRQIETPPAIDPSKIEAFASGADNAERAKHVKITEPKVVRDAFTMPVKDHQLFAEIQKQCLDMGVIVSKSEIVRAGLNYLVNIDKDELRKIIDAVPKLKTGRPTTEKTN